ncbi:MAG: PSD1 and planctomycete cytochrome C domain-containing protein [Lentisphaerales bacterium]|nr:PSD1 and planctomycete cytochrome C domain-containing protein [Lentisphaerales bacterium]
MHAEKISFNRDIRAILSDKCFHCHGPDENEIKGSLQLHSYAHATKKLGKKKNRQALYPGDLKRSEIYKRIMTEDEDDVMPPAESHKSLSSGEKDLIKKWILSGGKYEEHWAYQIPGKKTLPQNGEKHPIDSFIVQRLQKEGMYLSEKADRRTLIRRLTLDLTGLVPEIKNVQNFLNDKSKDAYIKLVERLLSSKHYGERMAQFWLDGARYADTTGYVSDKERTNWLYRDWVINAYNSNMPFDQFTIEQLAGDMLPNANDWQKIATGFHRNSMQAQGFNKPKEEYRLKAVADRIDTTGKVWLGLTMACAECHDHKYDPITQKEYFKMFAIFNNTPLYGKEPNRHGERITVEVKSRKVTAQVMKEMEKPRKTYIHIRGIHDQKGERVSPGVPAVFGAGQQGKKINRLSFAKGLVNGKNPLVARVIMNRLWAQFFNTGIVKTVEDFGSQGEWPSHPELLDWLAVEFVESGWDVKHMVKLIVTSKTYRQTSSISKSILKKDFYNRLLSHAPRHRLDAEQIRDNMLKISGLLNAKIGGASVRPYQPSFIDENRNNRKAKWVNSKGNDRYRRSLYTFWQRMIPYPSLVTFDAPAREISCVQRSSSNTPLQALVAMNDPVFMECAIHFATTLLNNQALNDNEARLSRAFERALSRPPASWERKSYLQTLARIKAELRETPNDVKALLNIKKPDSKSVQLAAWAMITQVILNLDETLNKE